jgi:chromosome segregation ATPase
MSWHALALTAERDFLRRQLESCQQQLEAAHGKLSGYKGDLKETQARVGELHRDLAASQQRIAELEAVVDANTDTAVHALTDAQSHSADLTAALRAIAPVYRAAEGQLIAVETWGDEGAAAVELLRAIYTARAALTPELLAMIEAIK